MENHGKYVQINKKITKSIGHIIHIYSTYNVHIKHDKTHTIQRERERDNTSNASDTPIVE